MSKFRGLRLRCILVTTAAVAGAFNAQAAELPPTRVVLSTSGVAQFNPFRTGIGGIDCRRCGAARSGRRCSEKLDGVRHGPARSARSACLARRRWANSFATCRSAPMLSNRRAPCSMRLVGSEVEIAGPVTVKGRVFGVEEEKVALPDNAGTIVRHRLTLMTETGLVQAVLEDLTALRFNRSAGEGANRTGARRRGRKPRQGAAQAVDRLSRAGHAQRRDQLHGGRARLEDCVSAGASQGRCHRAFAGLGGIGKPDRWRLGTTSSSCWCRAIR